MYKTKNDISEKVRSEIIEILSSRLAGSIDLMHQATSALELGGVAEGTVRAAALRSSLKEYPLNISAERDHVEALSSALAVYGRNARAVSIKRTNSVIAIAPTFEAHLS